MVPRHRKLRPGKFIISILGRDIRPKMIFYVDPPLRMPSPFRDGVRIWDVWKDSVFLSHKFKQPWLCIFESSHCPAILLFRPSR